MRLPAITLCVLLLAGCGVKQKPVNVQESEQITEGSAPTKETIPTEEAANDPAMTFRSLDVFRALYGTEYSTVNYLVSGVKNEYFAAANTIDGLIEVDQYGAIVPALAESWEVNQENTVWTFQIREGVKWVDYTGKVIGEVTAADWVTAAHYILEAHNKSAVTNKFDGVVLNAEKYIEHSKQIFQARTAVKDGIAATEEEYYKEHGIDTNRIISFDKVGVKALDTYTLEYTLSSPRPYFLSLLDQTAFLPVYEPFLEDEGGYFGSSNRALLYNGAYIFSEYEPYVKHTFTVNPFYWDKQKIYIRSIEYIYNTDSELIGPEQFQKGSVDEAAIYSDILRAWADGADTTKKLRPVMPDNSVSYFFAFNFEPRFATAYEPDNWTIAVNNENFRKSISFGLDRLRTLTAKDPYNPGYLLNNTITPATVAVGAGADFTHYEALLPFTEKSGFDETLALECRDKAKAELTDAGATFPIKILLPYNPTMSDWEHECQLIKSQLTALLGADYIDIAVKAGPETGFTTEVRRSGKFALLKCSWNTETADPLTWTEPFAVGNSYNFMYTSDTKMVGDSPANSKTPETQTLIARYYELKSSGESHTQDMAARFKDLAEAEAFLLEHAIVIPFSIETGGYIASRIDPFSGMNTAYGLSRQRFKGMKLLSDTLSIDDFHAAYKQWQADWQTARISAD